MNQRLSIRAISVGQYQDVSDRHGEPVAMTAASVFSSAQDVANKFSGATRGSVGRVFYTGLPDHPHHALANRQQCGYGGIVNFEVGATQLDAWRVVDDLN